MRQASNIAIFASVFVKDGQTYRHIYRETHASSCAALEDLPKITLRKQFSRSGLKELTHSTMDGFMPLMVFSTSLYAPRTQQHKRFHTESRDYKAAHATYIDRILQQNSKPCAGWTTACMPFFTYKLFQEFADAIVLDLTIVSDRS